MIIVPPVTGTLPGIVMSLRKARVPIGLLPSAPLTGSSVQIHCELARDKGAGGAGKLGVCQGGELAAPNWKAGVHFEAVFAFASQLLSLTIVLVLPSE